MDKLVFEFPAKADYLLSARLLASSIGARIGLDIGEIDDLKSGAAEACLMLMGEGYGRIRCLFDVDGDGMTAVVSGDDPGEGGSGADETEAELSRYMLEALMEDVAVSRDSGGKVTAVSFRKSRGRGQEP